MMMVIQPRIERVAVVVVPRVEGQVVEVAVVIIDQLKDLSVEDQELLSLRILPRRLHLQQVSQKTPRLL